MGWNQEFSRLDRPAQLAKRLVHSRGRVANWAANWGRLQLALVALVTLVALVALATIVASYTVCRK